MTDTTRDRSLGNASGASRRGTENRENPEKKHSARTEGTNRDFDESGNADNQGHGHPREEVERNSRD